MDMELDNSVVVHMDLKGLLSFSDVGLGAWWVSTSDLGLKLTNLREKKSKVTALISRVVNSEKKCFSGGERVEWQSLNKSGILRFHLSLQWDKATITSFTPSATVTWLLDWSTHQLSPPPEDVTWWFSSFFTSTSVMTKASGFSPKWLLYWLVRQAFFVFQL